MAKRLMSKQSTKLVEMVGTNMLQLQMEIEKLALYLGEELEITCRFS